jgi:uncharacterized membrane protein
MLLEEKNYDAAAWFAESSAMLSPAVQDQLNSALVSMKQEQKEAQRLQKLGRSNDPARSFLPRILLGGVIGVCLAMVGYSIFLAETGTTKVTGLALFQQSLFLLFPVLIVLVIAHKRLISDAVGHRAAVGVLGGVFCLILSRWAGYKFEAPIEAIVTMEKFLIAIAFANTPPAIPSGMKIALTCVLMGVLSIVFPSFLITASILVLVAAGFWLTLDYYTEWKHRG